MISAMVSDRHAVPIKLLIFTIATVSGAQMSEIMHELDSLNPSDHLEAQFVLASQSQWCSMQHTDRHSISTRLARANLQA